MDKSGAEKLKRLPDAMDKVGKAQRVTREKFFLNNYRNEECSFDEDMWAELK